MSTIKSLNPLDNYSDAYSAAQREVLESAGDVGTRDGKRVARRALTLACHGDGVTLSTLAGSLASQLRSARAEQAQQSKGNSKSKSAKSSEASTVQAS